VSQGIFAIGAIMGPALGPPLGGVLVDNANWNWVFDINVLPGIASFLILAAFLHDPPKGESSPLDLPGLLFLVAGIGSLQYVLSEGERWDWFSDTNNVLFACAAVIGIAALVWRELTTREPLVDLRIFRQRAVFGGFPLAMVIGGAIFGSTYTLPQLVQNSLDFTATLSGLLIFMRAIPIAIATPFISQFVGRVDARWFMTAGFIVLGFGNLLQVYATTLISTFGTFVIPLMLTGVGAALLYIPLSTAVLGGVPQRDGPRAAAYVNLGVQLGGSVLIAALSTLIDQRTAFHLAMLADNYVPGSTHLSDIAPAAARAGAEQLLSQVDGQATILAYGDATFAIAIMCFCAIALVFVMPKPRKGVKGGPGE
jgi:DHA2 family multidrug resistance protein